MVNKRYLLISGLLILLLACVTFTASTPTETVVATATETAIPTVTVQPTLAVPDYAGGVQWTDINGSKRLFMVEEPPTAEYHVDFASWTITLPNTHQSITILRHGEPRGYIFVGVWSYIHEDDANLLIDIAVTGLNDSGVVIKDLKVSVLDQYAPNMQLSQLKFSKDLIGTDANIVPVGLFDCRVIPSDPDGNLSETDGSSVFVAFVCVPWGYPTG